MGRLKSFNEAEVLKLCAGTFIRYGYEGASIDQLVSATGLLRGSLYSAYGSKRGLFLASLEKLLADQPDSIEALDLCLVALMELSAVDAEVRSIVKEFLSKSNNADWPRVLGNRLLVKASVSQSQ